MPITFDLTSGRKKENRVKIGIRVDYSPAVTAEPVKRCLAIAQQLKARGYQPVFISADSNIVPYITGTGFNCHMLESDWRETEMEADVLIDYLQDEGIDRLIIDQVHVTPGYFALLREAGLKLCYIDRRVRFPYDVDILVNYAPAPQQPDYEALYRRAPLHEEEDSSEAYDEDMTRQPARDDSREPESTDGEAPDGDSPVIGDEGKGGIPDLRKIRLLQGVKYIPMTEEYMKAAEGAYRSEKAPIPNIELPAQPDMASENVMNDMQTNAPIRKAGLEPVRDILFTIAGADTSGITEKFITGLLRDPELHDARIHLLCGLFFRITGKLQILIEDGRVLLHHEPDTDVVRLICSCDAAVAPAEPVMFEFCACGCPAVSFVFTEDQRKRADYLESEQLVTCAGDYRDDWKLCIQETIRALHDLNRMGYEGRRELAKRMTALVDGHGAERIAEAVAGL